MADEATSHVSVGAVLREQMLDAVRRAGWATSGLVVLIGVPEVTEPAWDDVLDPVPGEWRHVWSPQGAGALLAGLRAAGPPAPWTVVRLADLRRFLLPAETEFALEITSSLRGALRGPTDRPLLVVATMPPDREGWRLLTRAPASGGRDCWAQARALLRGAIVLTTHAPAPSLDVRPVVPGTVGVPPVVTRVTGVTRAVSPPVPSAMLAAPVPVAQVPAAAIPAAEIPAAEIPEVEIPAAEIPAAEIPAAGGRVPDVVVQPEPGVTVALREPAGEEAVVFRRPESAAPTEVGEPVPDGAGNGEPVPGRRPAPQRRPRPADEERPVSARWRPSALPLREPAVRAPEVLRDRALHLELAGNRAGAERLYEQAAQGGDLAALVRLAALRSGGGPRRLSNGAADRMYELAAAEGNTAVLFGLAAAGHPRALRLLARFREGTGTGDEDGS